MTSIRTALPWLLVALAIPVGLVGLERTSPAACDELPSAYARDVTTTHGGLLVAVTSYCRTERIGDGEVRQKTIVNWSGLGFAIGLPVAAWFVGATATGRISMRLGGAGIALSSALVAWAVVAFFA